MVNLILKDIFLVKKVMLWVMGLWLFFMIAARGFGLQYMVVTLLIAAQPMSVDEKNRTDVLYCSLPVKKSTIVYSRYLAALFTFVGVVAVCFLVFSIIENLGLPARTVIFPPISVQQFFTVTIFITLFVSGFFPFYFKYGYMKGQLLGATAITLVCAAFMGVLYIVVSLSGKTAILDAVMSNTALPWIFRFLIGVFAQAAILLGKLNLQVLIGIMTAVLLFVSVRVSVKFYNNKDL